jgi:hypothetical protein
MTPDGRNQRRRVTDAQMRSLASEQQRIDVSILGTESEIAADRPRHLPANRPDVLAQMRRHSDRRRARVLVDRARSSGRSWR